jgi:ATP-dependent helicase/DNAse subunit B
MHLLTGPAGSGKTTYVLDRFRDALRAGNHAIRLLVPTATMEQHLQNRLAREGFVFRRALVQTLHAFVENWAGDAPQVADTVLYLIVEEAARRVSRTEFARVVHMPGFCAALARTISEFSSAGCDSARLARCLPDAPLSPAFLAVYQEVDRALERRGFAMRARRLERAAERIERDGTDGIRSIWLDGFHALPDPELRVIQALGAHAEVTLTLADTDATDAVRSRLVRMGFREERTTRSRPEPAMAVVRAPGIEREAEEIARRILEQAVAGRPFREMGIIVRAPEIYVPILRSTLERFGIPARFYFDEKLEQHAVVRFLAGAIDAMLSGWDHAKTLALLRLAPRFADSNALDRFDFRVREQAPGAGLGELKSLLVGENGQPSAGAEELIHKLDSLAALEEWRGFTLAPLDWARRFRTLRNLFRPATLERATDDLVMLWRSQARVLELFDEVLDETAAALDAGSLLTLEEFWRAAKSVLRLKPLRLRDERRNVVHVLSAPEARQWVLPVIFVCGMVEKQFPQIHRQDPFFPDAARCRLNDAGVRVRTAVEFEREERALFHSVASRATMLVAFSYPEFDARGDRNLPSLFLDEDLLLAAQESRAVRPAPRHTPAPRGPVEIRAPELLEFLRQRTARVSPSGLERYLQCAFQYFGSSTLRLKTAPPRPEKRLSFLMQGSLVHEVLAAWYASRQSIEPLFENMFAEWCEKNRIPVCYETERLRNYMLEDLRYFAADGQWPRAGFQSRTEEKFRFPLDGSIEVSGKIDRLDTGPDGRAYVIDYKYSRAEKTKEKLTNENLLQAPLYVMAAEKVFGVQPAGMFYVGLKGGKVVYAGWSETGMLDSVPVPPNWLGDAAERSLQIVSEIRAGRIEVVPANPDNCRWCDFRDVCRIEAERAVGIAEGA